MDYITIGFFLAVSISSSIQPATSTSPLLLTPLIKENKTEDARKLSIVKPSLFLNLTSHSGFLTVDPRFNSNTFFWYFPVVGKPVDKTPWIIWLQGGPGASSLAGLFDEIGPFEFANGELKARKYAWTENHSMVFIDNPVGTGFSFTDSVLGYARNMSMYSNHLYSALQQFLTIFPELRRAPLFLAGESYAGRFVPGLASKILEQGKLTEGWEIELQGLIMGNPVLNREDVANLTAAFYQWGLLDSQGVHMVKPLQDGYAKAIKDGNNQLAYIYRNQLIDKLEDITLQQQRYNILVDEYKLHGFEDFLATEEVREALHVGNIKFSFDNNTVQSMLVPDFLTKVQTKVEKLLEKYKILIYCGQLDMTSPCVPNEEARREKWQWSHRDEFMNAPRVPWWYNESVAGYVRSGGGFTEALVRGAGHLVPIDKPAQALELISSFIKDVDMELPPNYEPVKQESTLPIISPPSETTAKPLVTTVKPQNVTKGDSNPKHDTKVSNKTLVDSKTAIKEAVPSVQSITQMRTPESGLSAGTIVSITFNVILVLVVALGAFLYFRLKRRSEDFFYSNVENNSDDIFLT